MLEAFFHPAPDGGQRLWLLHRPPADVAVRGAVVYAHPWAEEMNKSRRMAALAARALAADGWQVLQPDLAGCGDSSGDFGDATWSLWRDDLHQAVQSMQTKPLWLWGLRSGALLCAELARALPAPAHLLLWQPVQQGKMHLQQFLRLKAAARLADGGGKALIDAAKADLAAGRTIEVAGYEIAPSLAHGLEAAVLAPSHVPVADAAAPRLVWLETSSSADPRLSPAAQPALAAWHAAGWAVQAQAVQGPPFWQTAEIEDAPALVEASVAALRSTARP